MQYKRILNEVQKHVDDSPQKMVSRKAVAKITQNEFIKMRFPQQFKGLPALARDIIEKLSG